MAEFIAFDPNTEITGVHIRSVIEANKILNIDIEAYLLKYDFQNIQAEDWINFQHYLNFLKDLRDTAQNFYSLIALGTKVIENSHFPPNLETIFDVFLAADIAYHMNLRNGDVGNWHTEVIGEKHIRTIAHNPFPSDYDYGVCWGAAKRFAPAGTAPKVVRAESPCRLRGDDRCIYDITW